MVIELYLYQVFNLNAEYEQAIYTVEYKGNHTKEQDRNVAHVPVFEQGRICE